MIPPLTLIRATRPAPVVSAGWLASTDPLEWLREIAHCRRQGCEVAVFPVATSLSDPRPAGIFLLPAGAVPTFRPRVQRLAEISPGVHAPLDAVPSAGLSEQERDYFFPHSVHFFHPTLGLTGFSMQDAVAPARMLEIPPETPARWNHAEAASSFAPRFEAILVEAPPDLGEMLKAAAEDIGSQSDQPKPGSGWKKKAGLLGMGMAGGAVLGGSWVLGMIGTAADFLYGHGPAGRPPPTRHGALDRLREWAEKHWQQLADSRNREIERLIRLMDSDPDLGLRYALPLAGIEQSRGTARPTWKLGLNNPRYTLGHGGGAIDGWDVENDARLKLERQYREAAKREIALGRHDRAAYIYGNLLGDWTSAAQTLVNAGRHRDAVAIYLHKLHNRAAAAKCLEDAGLLLQAAAAYAEGKQYEKAGDLHAKLGNHAQARELWQAEHDALRDPLQKARLLSEKLDDLAGALELLDRTWQDGHRPSDALNAMFQIHRQADDAGAAKVLLDRMFDRRVPSMDLIAKLRLARAEATRWSDGEIKGVMEKHAFRKIAEALTAGGSDSKSLLEFLPGLDPDDRLLLRDAKRFSIRRNPPPLPKSGPLRGTLLPEQIVSLSSGIQWHSVAPLPKGASIAGYGQEMLAVGQLRENIDHRKIK